MARIRTVKPDFWDSERIGSLPLLERLTFIGLWNLADDEGRGRANIIIIHAHLHAFAPDVDRERLSAAILNLASIPDDPDKEPLLILYFVKGSEYYFVPGLKVHQRIDKPSPARFPPPPKDSAKPPRVLLERSKGEEEEEEDKDGEKEKERPRSETAVVSSPPAIRGTGPDSAGRQPPETVTGTKKAPVSTKDNPKAGRSKPEAVLPVAAGKLAGLLRDLILKNDPEARVPKNGTKLARKWGEAIDKLIRIDQRSPVLIEAVIRWSQDSDFWAPNIRSADTLRSKFPQLRLQRDSEVPHCRICAIAEVEKKDTYCRGCRRCNSCGVDQGLKEDRRIDGTLRLLCGEHRGGKKKSGAWTANPKKSTPKKANTAAALAMLRRPA